MKMTSDQLIDRMMRALGVAAYDSGKVVDPNAWWPLNYLMYRTLFFPDYYKNFLEDYYIIKKQYSLQRIAETFKYPTAIWLALVNLPSTMKVLGYDQKSRVNVTLDFIEMLRMRMAGNIFNEDHKNILWNEEKVANIVRSIPWIDTSQNPELQQLYERLHANLISLNEAIYWNANCSTREGHGPYKVLYKGKKAQCIIREFYNFHAFDLEPLLRNFPYKSCITYALYDTSVNFYFPVLNDYTHNVPLSDHTLAVYGKVQTQDGEKVLKNSKVVKDVCIHFENKGVEISKKVESMGKKRQVIESVRRVYYRTRQLKKILNKRWQPPQVLLQKIEKALDIFPQPTWRKLTRNQYLNIIDPRVD